MRVIKKGRDPATIKHQAECRNCGCVVEFTAGEVRRVSDQRDGDFYKLQCPTCQQQITKQVER